MTNTVSKTRRGFAVAIALFAVLLSPSTAGAADHSVFAYGDARFQGSTGNAKLNQPVVGMASNRAGDGYWLVSEEGRVFAFGDAEHLGSLTSAPPSPIIGIAATPNGDGYWLTAANGSVYSFGAAPFLGGLGNVGLAKPIVGIAASPRGVGYWLVASDGGIFSFGDARFLGSTGSIRLARSIVGMAATPSGGGYWLVAADGGLFTFGDARFHGSLGGGGLTEPAVGIAAAPTGSGYWIVTTGHLASSPTANPPQVRVYSGTYRVSALGPVFPGTYRAERATPTCSWERRGALSGDEAAVLGTRTSDDRQLVTIRPGDGVFRTSGCAVFVNDVFPITQRLTDDIGDGSYVIGLDIAPGTWSAPGGPECIWERVSDFSGAPDALKATDTGVDDPVVEIQPGDAGFVTSDCGSWSLQ